MDKVRVAMFALASIIASITGAYSIIATNPQMNKVMAATVGVVLGLGITFVVWCLLYMVFDNAEDSNGVHK